MRIQHNIMAMNAYRNYSNNVSAMKANLEKLSSGYKINRAGDDAAGLAISEKMRAQITGLETASKNAKDGISLVQTAEGALTEVHDMLNRMVELATQSANGTYDVGTDRIQLQKEMDELRAEINRIADSANFNGIKLLDGSMDATSISGVNYDAISASKLQSLFGVDKDGNSIWKNDQAWKGKNQDHISTGSTGKRGMNTLETEGGKSSKAGFQISLDGVRAALGNGVDFKLQIGSGPNAQEIIIKGADHTGDFSSSQLAKFLAEAVAKGSTGTFKLQDANGNWREFNVSANDQVLIFTAVDEETSDFKLNNQALVTWFTSDKDNPGEWLQGGVKPATIKPGPVISGIADGGNTIGSKDVAVGAKAAKYVYDFSSVDFTVQASYTFSLNGIATTVRIGAGGISNISDLLDHLKSVYDKQIKDAGANNVGSFSVNKVGNTLVFETQNAGAIVSSNIKTAFDTGFSVTNKSMQSMQTTLASLTVTVGSNAAAGSFGVSLSNIDSLLSSGAPGAGKMTFTFGSAGNTNIKFSVTIDVEANDKAATIARKIAAQIKLGNISDLVGITKTNANGDGTFAIDGISGTHFVVEYDENTKEILFKATTAGNLGGIGAFESLQNLQVTVTSAASNASTIAKGASSVEGTAAGTTKVGVIDLTGVSVTGSGKVTVSVGTKSYTINVQNGMTGSDIIAELRQKLTDDGFTVTDGSTASKLNVVKADGSPLTGKVTMAGVDELVIEDEKVAGTTWTDIFNGVTPNSNATSAMTALAAGGDINVTQLASLAAAVANAPDLVFKVDDGTPSGDSISINLAQVLNKVLASAQGATVSAWDVGKAIADAVMESIQASTTLTDKDKYQVDWVSMDADGTKLIWSIKTDENGNPMKTQGNDQFDGIFVKITKQGDEDVSGASAGIINTGLQNVTDNVTGDAAQLANVAVNFDNVGAWKDGAQITIGDTTYTVALGEDSKFKNVKNVIDLTDLKGTEDDFAKTAAQRLTVAAKDNSIFSVGHDGAGNTTLQQRSQVKESTDMSTKERLLSYLGVSIADADSIEKAVAGKSLTLQIGDTAESYNQLRVSIGDTHTAALGLDGISIADQDSALAAIDKIKTAINTVSDIRGTLGATQNRLDHTINNLSVMTENIQDAESTIRDTDIAEEMMAYTKNNILIQAAQAMLAQANQVPQGVLQLLQ